MSRPSPFRSLPSQIFQLRTAAKALPMPEEFPEQHSPSFLGCFETVLRPSVLCCQAGLAPAFNGKHMCQTLLAACWGAPWCLQSFLVPMEQLLPDPPVIYQALLRALETGETGLHLVRLLAPVLLAGTMGPQFLPILRSNPL